MNDFIIKIKAYPDYIGSDGRSEEEIRKCEKELRVKFASDYRTYLSEVGLACFNGCELTGICNSQRLNVVCVTQDERKNNPDIAPNLYVIEQTCIDGIVIWQAGSGEVFQTMPGGVIQKIADSLVEIY